MGEQTGNNHNDKAKTLYIYRENCGQKTPLICHSTCVLLLFAPLLLVSFNFPKEISCLIQWEPVLGDSG